MALRVISTVLILFSVLFLPFWVSLILATIGMIFFRVYWEAIAIFFISDLLFGVEEARFFDMFLISSIFATGILFIVEFIKRKSKFYKK